MSNAARENSDAFQLLSAKSLPLGSSDLGDVFDHGKAGSRSTFLIVETGCRQLDPDDFAIFLHIPLLQLKEGYFAFEEPLGELDIRAQVVWMRDLGKRQLQEFFF